MKLSELLTVLKDSMVIRVHDVRSIDVFMGEVSIAGMEIPERYQNAVIINVFTEYFKGWGKTGLTIVVTTRGGSHE